MPDPRPNVWVRFLGSALGLFATTSIQGAVCLSVGGALTYVGLLMGRPWHEAPLLLLAGMAIPLWPLQVYLGPERALERKFKKWDRWVEQKVITARDCGQWKRELREWYAKKAVVPTPRAHEQTPMLPLEEFRDEEHS
jgi:hypothetical protein